MGIFQALEKYMRKKPQLRRISINPNPGFGQNVSVEQESDAKTYMVFSWVHFCVSQIAQSAAQAELKIIDTGGPEAMDSLEHPFLKLLKRPNHVYSRFSLLETLFSQMELTGNAFLYVAYDQAGMPAELWPLRPERVTVVPDRTNFIKGYVYEVEGTKVPLEVNDVVHFKWFHPLDDYRGLSPIRALSNQLIGDQAAVKWNSGFFNKDNAIPAGVVAIKSMIDDDTYKRIVKEWRDAYGDGQRKTAFIRGSDMEWVPISSTQEDMQFLEMRKWTREEIFQVFGVPIGKWSENATEANAQVAEQTFLNDTLWPKLVRVAEELTAHLIQPVYGPQYEARFSDVRTVKRQELLNELQIVARGAVSSMGQWIPIMTVNEIRNKYFKLPPLDAVDEPEEQTGDPIMTEEAHGYTGDDADEVPPGEPAKALWQRKALKALKKGKSPAVPFETNELAPDERLAITMKLAEARTPEEVKAAFAVNPFRLESYP
jgi:HK97 family phage portal protein